MELWLITLFSQSLYYSLFLIGIVAFLESLALVGLLVPGIILMTTLGTLIGDGSILFYPAWISGTIGCLLGDWISYYIGFYCKSWLYKFNFIKKHQSLLEKTKAVLHKHSTITVFVGRFIGPTRPFIPMVSGMLKLPLKKFIFPSTIGCILWPPVYFFPGIVTGITINIPENSTNDFFKWYLLSISILIWLGMWSVSKWWNMRKKNHEAKFLTKTRTGWLALYTVILSIISLISIQFHPSMSIFRRIFFSILLSGF
ncbi:DedA family protein [Buchnera aphidicola (Hyadaphis tataricae)]|uniref:DedA family protein n=1 Tax=Buchnera aphidicola (Hyadaphis tataricae) TaxID=1241859 RepID=A0A4D6XVN2_9GAMM|nr:DedA family protein [Buchnera aphidicola]QCI21456.1 DedA family protein [Buchnera aphidicola (Hyadaphis tataricae)]